MITRTVDGSVADGQDGQVVLAIARPEAGLDLHQVLRHDLATDDRLGGTTFTSVAVRLPDGTPMGNLVGVQYVPRQDAQNAIDDGNGDGLLELLADTIGGLWHGEIALAAEHRRNERTSAPADTLTQLANRQSWELQLRREDLRLAQLGDSASVVMVDLDDLKRRNENFGHEAGDEQLREAARICRDAADGRHFAARTSGDEFGILMLSRPTADVDELAQNLRHSLSALGVPATVAVAHRLHGESLDDTVARAKASMVATHAEAAPPTGDPGAQAELLEALERGAIRAYFQPIVDLRTGEVVALEALARWQTPDGVREPDQFLHRLQEAGLLGALFDRIVDDGLSWLVEFRHVSPNLQLAVNFEFDAVPEKGLLQCILDRTAQHGLPTSVLSLELSERQSFDLAGPIRAELLAVADAGVRLMLDDFGTGFASLETLTSLPVSGVKLDRRFTGQVVSGDREPAVVKAMISMAAEAGLVVIAEGIETQTQCDRLVRLGCRLGQGYLFALPQPPDSVTAVLSAPLVSAW